MKCVFFSEAVDKIFNVLQQGAVTTPHTDNTGNWSQGEMVRREADCGSSCCFFFCKVYRISSGRVSASRDAAYNSTSSDYDIIVTNETQFQELQDDETIPMHSLRPQPLAELTAILGGMDGGAANAAYNVDVIGVILDATPMACTIQHA